jgi:pimeloyl-ACP methyl ester carboxylesterase
LRLKAAVAAIAVAALITATILIGAMFEFQDEMLFPTGAVAPAGPLPPSAETFSVRLADGNSLQGVHIPPDRPDPSRTLILGFGGNAWNGQHVAEYLHELYPDHDVVAFHYRGYKPSTGSPSADALIADAPLIYDASVERVTPHRVVAVGFSIGSGVAARLAISRKLSGVILVTPFDSLKAVAQSMFPWLPIGPFFRHEIDAAGALRTSETPVAIVAAGEDEIILAARTEALRKAASHLVYDRTIAGAGHNDIYQRSEFQHAMDEALDRLKA